MCSSQKCSSVRNMFTKCVLLDMHSKEEKHEIRSSNGNEEEKKGKTKKIYINTHIHDNNNRSEKRN